MATANRLTADHEGIGRKSIPGDTGPLPGITMIFTSDAVYPGGSYGPLSAPAAVVHDLEDRSSSVKKLRGIQGRTDATMVFGHDAEQVEELRRTPEASCT